MIYAEIGFKGCKKIHGMKREYNELGWYHDTKHFLSMFGLDMNSVMSSLGTKFELVAPFTATASLTGTNSFELKAVILPSYYHIPNVKDSEAEYCFVEYRFTVELKTKNISEFVKSNNLEEDNDYHKLEEVNKVIQQMKELKEKITNAKNSGLKIDLGHGDKYNMFANLLIDCIVENEPELFIPEEDLPF